MIEADAGGVFDGVEDGGGGAVHGELADSFGAAGSVSVGILFEVHADWRDVSRRWDDVVGHLIVCHAPIFPDYVLK